MVAATPSVVTMRGPSSQPRIHRAAPTETAAEAATIAGFASGSPSAARKPSAPKAANPSAASAYRRRDRMPSAAPMAVATATTNSSRASLSFVPNSVTTTSLAPGGWRSITTWPTAATSDVAPGRIPAISSDSPRAARVATAPAMPARASGWIASEPGVVVVVAVLVEVVICASCIVTVTFACQGDPDA